MGKNQSASNLTNIIKQDASGSIAFMHGNTMLMSISSSGTIETTGNVAGTASYASNAELLDGLDSTVFTLTSSFAAQTASFTAFTSSVNSFSASILSYTASQNILNRTYATTGSNTFAGIQTVNSNLIVTGSITAQTLVVQTITSSVDFVTGSTRFGSILGNTHVFTGSVSITGSLAVVTTGTEFQVTAAGVNFGNVIGDTHNITGSVGISGSLSGVGATFSGAYGADAGVKLFGTTYGVYGASRGTSAYSAGMNYISAGVQRWFAGIYENTSNFGFYNAGNNNFPLILDYSTGAATFLSSVTANGNLTLAASVVGLVLNDTSGAAAGSIIFQNNGTQKFNLTTIASSNDFALYNNGGTNSYNLYIKYSTGNIGIGTTSPEGPLHVNGAISGGYVGLAICNKVDATGTSSGIDFGSDNSTCYNGAGNGQIVVRNTGGGNQKSEMNLKIWNGSALITGINISDAGRVSFPTTTAQNYGLSNATAVTINSGSGTIASCSITSVGKPILINLTGDINPVGGPSWCYLYIYRNGSPIGKLIIAESPGASTNIPFALSTIDIPGAGTHTYTGYTTIGGSNPIQFGETGNSQAPTILAVELI